MDAPVATTPATPVAAPPAGRKRLAFLVASVACWAVYAINAQWQAAHGSARASSLRLWPLLLPANFTAQAAGALRLLHERRFSGGDNASAWDAYMLADARIQGGQLTVHFAAPPLPADRESLPLHDLLTLQQSAGLRPPAEPGVCFVRGTTILVANYQQHIPHFAEGLFFALSGLLERHAAAHDALCAPGRPCSLLFHQHVNWPERRSIAWHEGALAVAAAALGGGLNISLSVLNPDLHNVLGAGGTLEGGRFECAQPWGASADGGGPAVSLFFERLVLLGNRPGRRWFTGPAACDAYRQAALALHSRDGCAPAAAAVGSSAAGAGGAEIAILSRRGSRRLVNEGDVEAAVRARFGADVCVARLQFEEATFAEQVRALRGVRLLVAPHGAALTNLPFLPAGAALVEVFPLHWRPAAYFDSLAASCGVSHHAVQNFETANAELDPDCAADFGGQPLPPLQDCRDQNRCLWCGKQSSTRVDIAALDAALAEAQKALATSASDASDAGRLRRCAPAPAT